MALKTTAEGHHRLMPAPYSRAIITANVAGAKKTHISELITIFK
jgi:hypothetical protein